MEIEFTQLPEQSKLYTDYLSDFEKVRKYYNVDFSDDDELRAHFTKVAADIAPRRAKLVELLRSQNARLNSSADYEPLLENLSRENAVAVVTGQQVGLFCGPLYTLFKTISAVKSFGRAQGEVP